MSVKWYDDSSTGEQFHICDDRLHYVEACDLDDSDVILVEARVVVPPTKLSEWKKVWRTCGMGIGSMRYFLGENYTKEIRRCEWVHMLASYGFSDPADSSCPVRSRISVELGSDTWEQEVKNAVDKLLLQYD